MSIYINARFLTQSVTGVQRYATELSKILKQQLPGIKFISPQQIIQKELAAYLEAETIGKFSGHIWEQIELPLFLAKNNNPLLINFCNTAPLLYKNQVVTIHDLSFMINPEWFSKPFYIYYSLLIPKIARRSIKILTPSEHSQKDLIRILGIKKNKIEIVYNSLPGSFRTINETNFTNTYGKYILAVSSLDPRKNFANLINAYHKANLPDTKLVIVGSENKIFANQKLKENIQNNSSIVFTGYVSDAELFGLYKHADFFIYPSLYEGFGLPPLEAMACYCPTIVSNTSSLPEVCGEASHYVNPHNIEEITQAILQLSSDPAYCDQLRRKGIKRVAYFNWNISAAKVVDIIRKYGSA